MQVDRTVFMEPQEVIALAAERLADLPAEKQPDYITLVPDGEPTLDLHLDDLIRGLQSLEVPVAVITNGSLLAFPDVAAKLARADFISVKVDAGSNGVWKRINRPHRSLTFEGVQRGILDFAENYRGMLVTETMLVKDVNDTTDEIEKMALFLKKLDPFLAYIAIPTRPVPGKRVAQADPEAVLAAFDQFQAADIEVELLTGYEGDQFVSTGNLMRDLLNISAVHPLRTGAVERLMQQSEGGWETVNRLIEEGHLMRVQYCGHTYYIRKFQHMRGE